MAKFEISAEKRDVKGKGASRRLRREGKVPAVMYGAGKDVMMLAIDHDALYHNLRNEAFQSSLITVNVSGAAEQAVLRDVHMHPVKRAILHMDLQRVSATEKLHMKVPLHFINQDIAPGVKQAGGIVSHLMSELDITCLPKDLPEYLVVDMANININESVHLLDIKLPEGVSITALAHGGDNLAVATITMIRVEEEAPAAAAAPAEGAAAAAPAEGAAAAAAPAAKAAAPAAKKEGK